MVVMPGHPGRKLRRTVMTATCSEILHTRSSTLVHSGFLH
jgi:hypothetical protein